MQSMQKQTSMKPNAGIWAFLELVFDSLAILLSLELVLFTGVLVGRVGGAVPDLDALTVDEVEEFLWGSDFCRLLEGAIFLTGTAFSFLLISFDLRLGSSAVFCLLVLLVRREPVAISAMVFVLLLLVDPSLTLRELLTNYSPSWMVASLTVFLRLRFFCALAIL